MQGIGLLLQVVSKDPNNLKANFSLGLFSMKSGQYQKAINRFKTVVSIKPGGEAYFYLAQAYQNLQLKKEAIEAYIQSKKYIDDPQTLTSIDHIIKDLTN
jgi:tetratricopeptide (TPR) repeat protein